MSKLFEQVQPAVKKETGRVLVITATGVIAMYIVFFVLHMIMPDSVPFGITVILGGIGGGAVAVLNFFLMGLAVQKTAAESDEANARAIFKASYSRRMLIQIVWIILAIALPCFQFAAGILPLIFPSLGIKYLGIMNKI